MTLRTCLDVYSPLLPIENCCKIEPSQYVSMKLMIDGAAEKLSAAINMSKLAII